MKFSPQLERVTLLRRYKRFMADVVRDDGSEITVHCPNTGSMKNCVLGEPQQALISDSGNPKRKYRHTLEALQVAHGHWAGVNTSRMPTTTSAAFSPAPWITPSSSSHARRTVHC